MYRVTALILAMLTIPACAGVKKPTVLSFTTNDDGMVIGPITLGGAVRAHVIVDSGAGLDVFAPSLIEKLHGKPAGQFTGFRMTGERLDVPLFVIPEIRVGPVVRKKAQVAGWTVFDELHFDGIISVGDFREQAFTLDFSNKQIVFENVQSLAQRLRAGVVAPLKLDDYRGIALDLFSSFLIGSEPALCSLDTGSPNSTFSLRYMALLGLNQDDPNVTKRVSKNIAGVTTTRYIASVPHIALAADPIIRRMQPKVEFADIIYDCVLGIDFWSGRSLTIDIPHERLIVSRATTAR
jgi:hypothetical protein